MTIATTKQYSKKTVEAFTLASLTKGASSDNWDWAGETGKTVVITSNGVAAMSDYTRTGTSRYGTPTEIDNTQQEITCSKDRAFTFTVDAMGSIERGGTIEVNKQLRKQIDEVITPEVDIYTLGRFVTNNASGNIIDAAETITKANAYEMFLNANGVLDDQKVPAMNRTAWVSPAFYNMLKQDPSFTKSGEAGMQIVTSGVVGELDGVSIVKAPTSYLPAKGSNKGEVVAIIAHKDAWVQPIRLEEFKVHENPQGISGTLVEGRIVYDAFILERMKDGAAVKEGVVVLRNKYTA